MYFFLIEYKDILNGIMFEAFFNQNWGVKKFFSSAMWKKDDYLSDADADPNLSKYTLMICHGTKPTVHLECFEWWIL